MIVARYVISCCLAVATGVCCSGLARSQVESASGADAAPARAQPAQFGKSRFEIRDEYRDLQGDATLYMIVPRIDFSANSDLSLRIETPIVFGDPGTPNNATEAGVGDVLFRGSYRFARGAGYAIVAGSELILNTARKDLLGTGKDVIAPLIFAAIDLPRYNSIVFPFLQHYATLGGDEARRNVHYTSIKSVFLTRWQTRTYSIFEPQVIVDHERADKVGATLDGEIGRLLNRDTAIWVRTGFGLFGDRLPEVYDWKFEVGVRFFPK